MKNRNIGRVGLIGVAAIVCAGALCASAQTLPDPTNAPPVPTSPGNFFSSVMGFFSSFDTALDPTFGQSRGQAWTGVDAINGGPASLANEIGLSYDFYRTTPTTNSTLFAVSAESVTRNGGVTGTLISEGVGVGLSFIVHDVRLTGYLDGLYNFDHSYSSQFGAEFGLRAEKALGLHTFTYVGAAFQLPGSRQLFSAGLGFTF